MSALYRAPWWVTEAFDRTLRPLLYNPERIVRPFVGPGDRVADIGCGTGFFSVPLARLAGPSGELVLVDAEEEMLRRAVERVRRDPAAQARVTGVLTAGDDLPLPAEVDFALLSWMLHEVEQSRAYWQALRGSLRPAGKVLVIEPLVHVSAARYEAELAPAEDMGFTRAQVNGIFFSRAAVLTKV